MPGPVRNPHEPFQQLEAIMLRQMLQSSGAFRASGEPGSQLQTDLFVETLADAVAKGGGLGIAQMLEREIGGAGSAGTAGAGAAAGAGSPAAGAAAAGAAARAGLGASASFGEQHRVGHAVPFSSRPAISGFASAGASPFAAGAGVSVIDDLDDPNSEAPLPEDPSAPSIDDYQVVAAGASDRHAAAGARHVLGAAAAAAAAAAVRPHLHIGGPTSDHTSEPMSGGVVKPLARALNTYRERAEDLVAGTPLSAAHKGAP